MKKNDQHQLSGAFSLVGTIGLGMAATLLVGLFSGRAIDKWLNTFPWGTIIGIILGMLAGLWSTYKRVMEIESDK